MFDELSVLLLTAAVSLTALLVYMTSQGPDVPPYKIAYQCDSTKTRHQGESAVYRSRSATNGLVRNVYTDSKTLYEAFQRGLRNNADRPCLGHREGDSDFIWKTYAQVAETIDSFASGLFSLGVKPGQKTFVGIFSINRPEWSITEQVCNSYSMVTVALYDTLGQDAVVHIIKQCEMPVVVASADKLSLVIGAVKSCPSLKLIVCMDQAIAGDLVKAASDAGVKLITFKAVVELGTSSGKTAHIPPTPEDIATICYTSGTTGMPKGAVLTHGNLVANNAAIVLTWPSEILPTNEDCYLSYLPLAHMLERLMHTFVFANGARVGFFRGDTQRLLDDVAVLRPTYFASVPRLWNRIYDKVEATVAASSPFSRFMFNLAYSQKLKLLRKGIIRNNTIWDKLVFTKIRNRLGGRCKAMVTGAAPISPEVLDLLRIAFGCQVYEGYGQTEACAAISVTVTGDYSTGHVGCPLPCVELKLVDVPEMNYTAEDKPNPRGEICVRGTSVCQSYYKEPEKTREAIDADGWLHTGDVGEIQPNGTLKIIDRKKNIFKLAQGEYIAAEKIENVVIRSPFIEQAWVYGNSLQAALVAVVVIDHEYVTPWAKANGYTTSLPNLVEIPEVRKLFVEDMVKTCKSAKLHSFEIPKEFIVEVEPFSVENDVLTPTFKIKRQSALKRYENKINAAYNAINKK